MAKTVFRQNEIKNKEEKFELRLLHDYSPVVEEVAEEIPEYTGPTADDLRRDCGQSGGCCGDDRRDRRAGSALSAAI